MKICEVHLKIEESPKLIEQRRIQSKRGQGRQWDEAGDGTGMGKGEVVLLH